MDSLGFNSNSQSPSKSSTRQSQSSGRCGDPGSLSSNGSKSLNSGSKSGLSCGRSGSSIDSEKQERPDCSYDGKGEGKTGNYDSYGVNGLQENRKKLIDAAKKTFN